mmetsp:Transcript_34365/g.51894  ORF Transcript_34365/g.51894 Transcript_34365/m.51894 type:complete len:98 (+) Transcript_34365:2532-2825(+)
MESACLAHKKHHTGEKNVEPFTTHSSQDTVERKSSLPHKLSYSDWRWLTAVWTVLHELHEALGSEFGIINLLAAFSAKGNCAAAVLVHASSDVTFFW